MKSRFSSKFAQRFWSKVSIPSGQDACWEWQGCTRAGYGATSNATATLAAHRVAWELTKGPIPSGLLVCHKCDNRPCCRPGHLFLGTTQDNTADRHAKKRERYGFSNHATKLADAQIRKMRRLFLTGKFSQRSISKKFKVSPMHGCRILNGQRRQTVI